MKTTQRTDVHRPSQIVPADYEFVAFEYMKIEGVGDALYLQSERANIRAHMAQTGGTYSAHQHGGNCHICGASAIYTLLWYHLPTNSYVRTGMDCGEKLGYGDALAFRSFVEKVKAGEAARAGKNKAQALLAQKGLQAAWAIYLDPMATAETNRMGNEESTIGDIVGKLVKYGSISDKALSFLEVLVNRVQNRARIAAERAAQTAAAAPLPVSDKRQHVVGTILTVREPNREDFYPATKILVQHATGWKVWGTLPSGLGEQVKKGDVIEFDARLKVSDRDPKFGFFSRPTRPHLISQGGEI